MTLLALTISVGMIIDDSIVVLENTLRHMQQGMTRIEAAIAAMDEIGFAVMATSLAIAAVFVPVAFMEGMVGQFFYEFGMTVTFAVIVSTFIALTLSPMLCSRCSSSATQQGRFYRTHRGTVRRHRSRLFQAARVMPCSTGCWCSSRRSACSSAA